MELELSLSLSHSRTQLCRFSSFEPWPCRREVKWHHYLGLVPPTRALQTVTARTRYQSWANTVQKKNQKVLCLQRQEAPVLVGRSIEEVYDTLAERLISTAVKNKDNNSKYIVGLAGPPGAGKTTVASEVIHRINVIWSQKVLEMDLMVPPDEVATVLPMDGFHLYRSQLDAMENPKEAHARRGAPWTFNPDLLLKCLHTLRSEGSVYAPSFDHGVGDPIENDIFVGPQHKIVIVEGNYLFLEEDIWKEVSTLFDEKWFLDIDIDIAMQRVLKRHIFTGKEPHVAEWRVGYNDRPNAELILKSKKNADLVIKSVDF
ncbi:putative uridine kinase C227.14 isoform X1 [Typha latifolia]|uniref:putative uridine kinase C227.14 isoform X1 n=1 Tax=Typha latifolia TaxID=4733 RepID=UPI003C2C2DE9